MKIVLGFFFLGTLQELQIKTFKELRQIVYRNEQSTEDWDNKREFFPKNSEQNYLRSQKKFGFFLF